MTYFLSLRSGKRWFDGFDAAISASAICDDVYSSSTISPFPVSLLLLIQHSFGFSRWSGLERLGESVVHPLALARRSKGHRRRMSAHGERGADEIKLSEREVEWKGGAYPYLELRK